VLSAEPPSPWASASIEACNRLQEPFPDEWGEPHLPESELEAWLRRVSDPTTALDDAAHRAMRRDLRVVVQDLAASGKRPGQIALMFGLKRCEVLAMLDRGEQ
jgi:hypothetical protein